MKQNDRLRDNLLLRVLLPMAVVLLISGLLGYIQAFSFVNSSDDRSLLEEARALAQQVHARNGEVTLDLPAVAVEMLRADTSDRVYYQVRIMGGGVIAGDVDLPEPELPVSKPTFYETNLHGDPVRVVALPLQRMLNGEIVVVQMGETRHKTDVMAGDLVLTMLAPQLALMVLAWVAIRRGVTLGLGPLERLARSIEQRVPDDLAPLPAVNVPQEVQPLLNAFNALLLRLGNAAAAQKRFVADAAHQLRTPLAALRIQLERALRETDANVREALLHQLVSAVERTARLSSQLLLLARAEPGTTAVQTQPVDLCSIAFETGSQWVPRALQKGVDLGLATPDQPLWVRGETVMLGELVNNLLDNALRYGGKNITLRIQAIEQGVELAVEDDGPGVPPGEEHRIFERFHRSPGSSGDGSGLGLAIVREIARGFDAEVSYRTAENGGACFYVYFNALEPSQAAA